MGQNGWDEQKTLKRTADDTRAHTSPTSAHAAFEKVHFKALPSRHGLIDAPAPELEPCGGFPAHKVNHASRIIEAIWATVFAESLTHQRQPHGLNSPYICRTDVTAVSERGCVEVAQICLRWGSRTYLHAVALVTSVLAEVGRVLRQKDDGS